METLTEKFLSKSEREKVTESVQAAERVTSGEIVPMVVSASHDYPMAAVICSASLATPLALLLTFILGSFFWVGPQNMWLFLTCFAIGFTVIYKVCKRSPKLKRYFLFEQEVEKEVQKAALAAFYEEQLYKTRDENGILIYISVLEQKVWILGDTKINKKIEQQVWNSVVDELTAGIKAGKQCKALCEAIVRIGSILQNHFPYQKDDTDELHNLIIR